MKPIKLSYLVSVIIFAAVGCENKLNKLPEPTKPTKQTEQTQSLKKVPAAGAEAEELGIIIERNVPVPMRDGVILRADVHRPDRGGPYPVLVHRTQYNKGAKNFNQFVKAGYIVVSQDVRGRYESEGEFESFLRVKSRDAQDGYDTVEWAATLPGSTDKVGTIGNSDPGMRQWPLAALRPASLKAMSACRSLARITDLMQGTFKPLLTRPVLSPETIRRSNRPGVYTRWEAEKLWAKEKQKWLLWLPWSELPREVLEDETEAIGYLLKNPNFDTLQLDNCCTDIVVPNLAIYGWFDSTESGDILLFQKMVKEAKSEIARKGSRLIIGPWIHTNTGRRIDGIDFGPHARRNETNMRIRWFDYWLKGKQNGVDKDAPVSIFVMGDNQWRDEQSWPLYRAKEKILYITSDGSANTPAGSGCLTEKITHESGTDRYEYDPRNPVLSPYGLEADSVMFPSDQRRLAVRQDILVYQTEPLTERMEVTGFPVVELYAGSSTPDTDWVVRLIDVYPEGPEIDISHGFLRARFRNGLDKPELIKPDKVVKYTIRMRPTSNAFLPGHRIRLDITSSDFPNYDRNHNTAADQYTDAALVTASQTIYHGGEHATRIVLPWVSNPIEKKKPIEEEGDEPQPKQQTVSLHQAVEDGDVEQIKLFLSDGADVNARDENGRTALHIAAANKHKDIAELLIDKGAHVNARDKSDYTPLYHAIWTEDIKMISLLVSNGADVNLGPEENFKPLLHAIWTNDLDIVELLIQKDADINVNSFGMPLLSLAFDSGEDMAELLLVKGVDFTWKLSGLAPLHYAAVSGYPKIAELLLSKGAKVDGRDDNYEFTALHYAARFGNKNVAEVLIAHGVDIKAKDKWDYQPIHWAAYHDRPEIVELLITKGADVNAKTSLGQTPLELAKPRRNTKTIELLRKYSNQIDASTSINVTNSDKSYVVLERGDVRAVIVNNEPVDEEVLP